MMNKPPYQKLADLLTAEIAILRQANAIVSKYFPTKPAAPRPRKKPLRRSTNGSGAIIPATAPKDLTFEQRRAWTSFLIHQIVGAAGQPIVLEEVMAKLKEVSPKASPLTVASALRRGVIKRGPGFSSTHRVYVAGKLPPAFADQAG